MEALGGKKLEDHIFRAFSKELESETLADLGQSISDNLQKLLNESDQQAEFNRAFVTDNRPFPGNRPQNPMQQKQFQSRKAPRHVPAAPAGSRLHMGPPCKYFQVVNPSAASSHSLQNCFEL